MTEACSGRSGSLAAVTWYLIPANTSLGASEDLPHANWSAASNRIVLAEESLLDGSLVRHEMLHALIQASGHARSDFLERCGGVVRCSAACVADAGSPPSIDPATVRVTAKELVVALEIIPTRPSALEDSGVFSVIVKATNSRSYAVVMVGSPGVNVSFGYQLLGPLGEIGRNEPILDKSVVIFRAGETKQHVFDFVIGSAFGARMVPADEYSVSGYYGLSGMTNEHVMIGP